MRKHPDPDDEAADRRPHPADDPDDRRPHPAAPEDSSGNHPATTDHRRRPDRDTPLEDDEGRALRGHPSGTENFRGGS